MNKTILSAISIFTFVGTVIYLTYLFLLHDTILHSSISSIVHNAHHFTLTQHLFILGLLPIYIAGILFGASMIGLFLASRVANLLKTSKKMCD